MLARLGDQLAGQRDALGDRCVTAGPARFGAVGGADDGHRRQGRLQLVLQTGAITVVAPAAEHRAKRDACRRIGIEPAAAEVDHGLASRPTSAGALRPRPAQRSAVSRFLLGFRSRPSAGAGRLAVKVMLGGRARFAVEPLALDRSIDPGFCFAEPIERSRPVPAIGTPRLGRPRDVGQRNEFAWESWKRTE